MLQTLPSRQTNFYTDIFSEFQEKSTGGLKIDDDLLEKLAQNEPAAFLEAAWDFTVGALPLGQLLYTEDKGFRFPSDACRDSWDIRTSSGVLRGHHFGFSLVRAWSEALEKLSNEHPAILALWYGRLQVIPLETPQMLLLDLLRLHPERHSDRALEFLLGDERRLELGEQQFETRRLIRAASPFWSKDQCLQLESVILKHWELPRLLRQGIRHVSSLRWHGSEQWRLLHALPKNHLSEEGHKRLLEWDRKFVGWPMEDVPVLSWGGFVGSPIDGPEANKMSDKDWLRALTHYAGKAQHRDHRSLRGGAEQLGRVLQARTVEQPERFARLFLEHVPLDNSSDI